MLRTKACPRCRGDVTIVRDVDDVQLSCLQCGFVLYVPRPLEGLPKAS
jgi:hypothetical protein